ADRRAAGLLALGEAMAAELALDDLRRGRAPLELRHVEGAGHLAVAAADAGVLVVGDDAELVLVQRAEHAGRHARGVRAVHALRLQEGALVVLALEDADDV